MANFCSVPKEERITEVTIPNSMAPGAKPVTIGLMGYLDFQGKELSILRPPYIEVTKGTIKGNVRMYEISSYHPGDWTLEALTPEGQTWDKLIVHVAAPRGDGSTFTSNPLEVVTRRTTPTALQVVEMLKRAWPDLTEAGARTLTAQFMGETGSGKHCYNWNLGNVKSDDKQPHMFLKGVWEVDSPERAKAQMASAGGLAHIATAEEIKKHGWGCPPGSSIVVFQPPHPQCRFRAYRTLEEGAQRWMGNHQRIAKLNPGYLASVNAGDTAAVAHTLKKVRYYTASESDYARSMAAHKTRIDHELGSQ